jgi:hypothetical protein
MVLRKAATAIGCRRLGTMHLPGLSEASGRASGLWLQLLNGAASSRRPRSKHLTPRAGLRIGPWALRRSEMRQKKGGRLWADIAGQRFGKLTALVPVERNGRGIDWLCRCRCHCLTVARRADLKGGRARSCGCADVAHATGLLRKAIARREAGRQRAEALGYGLPTRRQGGDH